MTESETERSAPPVESFDPWKLSQPEDGIVYLYRSFVDGFWRVINDEDMALQEATGYPVGELIEHEEMGDYEDAECGELRAIYVPPDDTDTERFEEVSHEEQRRAIQKMLDVQWSTNWTPLPVEAEQHVERAFEHLVEAREITERHTGHVDTETEDSDQ